MDSTTHAYPVQQEHVNLDLFVDIPNREPWLRDCHMKSDCGEQSIIWHDHPQQFNDDELTENHKNEKRRQEDDGNLSYFAPQAMTPMFSKYHKTSFDFMDQSCQKQTFTQKQQRLQDLADKIGLDGIALCSNEEDFTIDKDLNFELLRTPSGPWYEALKGQSIQNLFNDSEQGRPTISHVHELFLEDKQKRKKSLPKDVSDNQDLFKKFEKQIKENSTAYHESLKHQYDQETLLSLLNVFQSVQANIRLGESPERQVVRFALDFALQVLEQTSQHSEKSGISAALSSQLRDTQSSQMRDAISEIISDSLSDLPIPKSPSCSNSSNLQKRSKKTTLKDESKIRKTSAIHGRVMGFSIEQVSTIAQTLLNQSAPGAPVYYSKLKLPTAREVLRDALLQMPEQQGTKQEILDVAGMICPHARREVNQQFNRTLEQALSKYLTVVPKMVSLNCYQLSVQSRDINFYGQGPSGDVERNLKKKIIVFLQSAPNNKCQIIDLVQFGNQNSIERIIKRNPTLFQCQDKTYRLSEDEMRPPDHPDGESCRS